MRPLHPPLRSLQKRRRETSLLKDGSASLRPSSAVGLRRRKLLRQPKSSPLPGDAQGDLGRASPCESFSPPSFPLPPAIAADGAGCCSLPEPRDDRRTLSKPVRTLGQPMAFVPIAASKANSFRLRIPAADVFSPARPRYLPSAMRCRGVDFATPDASSESAMIAGAPHAPPVCCSFRAHRN